MSEVSDKNERSSKSKISLYVYRIGDENGLPRIINICKEYGLPKLTG
jgi:hypothetical protein